VSVEKGYVELEKAFDKLHTERLAYNIVRVGARLNRLDVPRLMKLIDHASFRDDSAGLDNLYNLAMHQFVKHNRLDQAVALYDRLLKEKRTQSLAPIFSFLVLMHTGEYERIQGEVQADSLEALTAAD
jgi:pentatricopeptide repeat protein